MFILSYFLPFGLIFMSLSSQGKKTGCYYWPCSDVVIQGLRPDIWFNFSYEPDFPTRVDTVVNWFKTDKVDLATLYFHEPDVSGHRYGPDTPEVKAKVKELDGVLGYLVKQMKANKLDETVNIIVTSDHGMTTVDRVNRV